MRGEFVDKDVYASHSVFNTPPTKVLVEPAQA